MDILVDVIKGLKPKEIKLVTRVLKLNDSSELLRVKLFRFLLDNIERPELLTDLKASQHVYGEPQSSKFTHLKRRLRNDMLNSLLFQEANKRYKTKLGTALFETRKLIMEGHILLSRGAVKSAMKLFREADLLIKKYELYSEGLALKNLLFTNPVFYLEFKKHSKGASDFKSDIKEFENIMVAQDIQQSIAIRSLYQANTSDHEVEKDKKMIQALHKLEQESSSLTYKFQHYITAVTYYDRGKSFKKALNYATKLENLINNSSLYNSVNNIAGVNLTLSSIYLNLRDFKLAAEHAEKALELFEKGRMNELSTYEQLFFCQLRLGNLEVASELIQVGINHPQAKRSKIIQSRWLFFKGFIEFLNNNLDTAIAISEQNKELFNDKTGWYLGDRILEMMILLVQGQLDILDYRVTAFYQHIQRYKESSTARAILIHSILRDSIKTNDLLQTKINKKVELEKLKKAKGELYWDPKGFEVIRFDKWFNQIAETKLRLRTLNN